MPDVDPYVAPPAEPAATPRLIRLRPLLVVAIVLLLIGAWVGAGFITDRQDPTLQIPDGVTAPPDPAGTSPGPDPTAPTLPDE